MANFFDQFDEPPTAKAKNFFDQFDEPPAIEKDSGATTGTLGTYGKTLWQGIKGIPSYGASVIEGNTPYSEDNVLDKMQRENELAQQAFVNEPGRDTSALGGLATQGEIRGIAPSLSGSIAGMVPMALGSFGGPVGTAIGSGLSLYGMTRAGENEFIRQKVEQENANRLQQGLPGLSQQEKIALQDKINASGDTLKSGLAQSIPETLGNAAELAIAKTPIGEAGKFVSKLIPKNALARAGVVGLGKFGATQATELGEEEITRRLQNPINERNELPTQSFGDIAKPTLLATLPFAGLSGSVGAYQGYKSAKVSPLTGEPIPPVTQDSGPLTRALDTGAVTDNAAVNPPSGTPPPSTQTIIDNADALANDLYGDEEEIAGNSGGLANEQPPEFKIKQTLADAIPSTQAETNNGKIKSANEADENARQGQERLLNRNAPEQLGAFVPTHETSDGTPVALTNDNAFVDANGDEYVNDGYITPINQDELKARNTSVATAQPETSRTGEIAPGIITPAQEEGKVTGTIDATVQNKIVNKRTGLPFTTRALAESALNSKTAYKEATPTTYEVNGNEDDGFVLAPKPVEFDTFKPQETNVQKNTETEKENPAEAAGAQAGLAVDQQKSLPITDDKESLTPQTLLTNDNTQGLIYRASDNQSFETEAKARQALKNNPQLKDDEHDIVPVTNGYAIAPTRVLSFDQYKALPRNKALTDDVLARSYEAETGNKPEIKHIQDMDKNDPDFEKKNLIRQLENGLVFGVNPQGRSYNEKEREEIRGDIEKLKGEIGGKVRTPSTQEQKDSAFSRLENYIDYHPNGVMVDKGAYKIALAAANKGKNATAIRKLAKKMPNGDTLLSPDFMNVVTEQHLYTRDFLGAEIDKHEENLTARNQAAKSATKKSSNLNRPPHPHDELQKAIGKLGGISRAQANRAGFSDYQGRKHTRTFNNGANAKTFDEMAEALREYGYNIDGENDLIAKIDESLRGNGFYTPEGYEEIARIADEEKFNEEEAKFSFELSALLQQTKEHDQDNIAALEYAISKGSITVDNINEYWDDLNDYIKTKTAGNSQNNVGEVETQTSNPEDKGREQVKTELNTSDKIKPNAATADLFVNSEEEQKSLDEKQGISDLTRAKDKKRNGNQSEPGEMFPEFDKANQDDIVTNEEPINTRNSPDYKDRIHTLDVHENLFKRVHEGKVSAEEFKASFDALMKNKAGITTELSSLTKDVIFKTFPGLTYRYKSENKASVINAAYIDMLQDFTLGQGFSYVMGENSSAGIQRVVDKVTDNTLDKFAEDVKKSIEDRAAKREEIKKGIENPETLDDYARVLQSSMADGLTFSEARLALTPEQRVAYDSMAAEKTRGERMAREDQQKNNVQVTAQTTEGQIVETKHTKTGEDLYVVKAADRVDRDIYNHWNATAKRLGGYYSSFKGIGAVPGFQFKIKENAESFLKFIGGDVEQTKEAIQTTRDSYADDKSQSAVERLNEMADRLDEKADESLSRERKVNTYKRASEAARSEARANMDKAMAGTMRNIAKAINDGSAKLLDRVRQKVQVEMLQSFVNSAHSEMLNKLYPDYGERMKHQYDKPTDETADYLIHPAYTAYRSDLANLGRSLLETEGTRKLGQRLMKVADDVSAEYLKFAKDNLHKVTGFTVSGTNKPATFTSKQDAEKAISRSGYKGTAIVLPFKRGENVIILSPSEAIKRGIWQGDNDKRITLSPEFGAELVEKIGKTARRGKSISVPWQFENAYDKRKRLAAMGIETPAELRVAIREFINLQETAKEVDKIKKMERAMIGRANDGLDFFPTPAGIVDEMIDAADIKEGMSVLEPSAGMGHIAERIREAGVEPDVIEVSNSRKELLEAKEFNVVGHDFMDIADGSYDRIIMNPPFGDRRDALHVQHAYELLKPGGRLVAVMGEGVFFGQDKKAQSFREWLEKVGGTEEKLAEGSFLDPSLPVNTSVNARLVVIDKPLDTNQIASFSRRAGVTGNAISRSVIDSVIKRVIAASPSHISRDTVIVADTFADLPPAVREEAAQQGYDNNNHNDRINGVTYQGKVYLVQENIQSELEVEETLLHERIHQILHGNKADPQGHELKKALNVLYLQLGGMGGINALAEQLSINLKAARKQALTIQPGPARNAFIVDEFLAEAEGRRAYEKLPAKAMRALREFYGKLRAWLKGNGFTGLAEVMGMKLDSFSPSDLAYVLRNIRTQEAETGSNAIRFHTVWHGSPHDHEGFDSSKIGTGEGELGWGYGMHFTESKGNAVEYKRKLEKDKGTGKVYKVNIPDIKTMLDLNTYGDKQSRYVRNALMSIPAGNFGITEKTVRNDLGDDYDENEYPVSEAIDNEKSNLLDRYNGQSIYELLVDNLGGEFEASNVLANAGIKGNTHNTFGVRDYIVFNDADIKIEAKYSRSQSTKTAYEQRIDELFSKENPNRKGVKVLDRSDILDLLGYGDKPVYLEEGKVVDGKYNHGLTDEHWKKIPEWLDNPALVFDSDTVDERLVFIAPDNLNGKLIRIIVHPDANTGGLSVNLLVNAYDAKTDNAVINRWVKNSLLRYFDKEGSLELRRTSGLQLTGVSTYLTQGSGSRNTIPNSQKNAAFPNRQGISNYSENRILQKNDLVNYRKQQQANGLNSRTQAQVENPHTETSLIAAMRKVMDKTYGAGWFERVQSTDKVKAISRDDAAQMIGVKFSKYGSNWETKNYDHIGLFDYAGTIKEYADILKGRRVQGFVSITRDEANRFPDSIRIATRGTETTGLQGWFMPVKDNYQANPINSYGYPDSSIKAVYTEEQENEIAKIMRDRDIVSIDAIAKMGGKNDATIKILRKGTAQPEALYSKDGVAQAFYNPDDDTLYFIYDNISMDIGDKELKGLILHEGVHALRLGKNNVEFQAILKQLENMKKLGNEKVLEAFNSVPEDTKPEHINEEAAAYLVQTYPDLPISRKIIAWARNVIRAIGKTLPALERKQFFQWANALSEEDIIYMANAALRSAPESLLFDNVGRENNKAMLSQKGNVPRISSGNKEISWSEERINSLLRQYAYSSNASKTKAYAAWISPEDFLGATTSKKGRARLEEEKQPLDRSALKEEAQEITLNIYELQNGNIEVTGHEGRHRMMALSDSGVKYVPVTLYFDGGKVVKPLHEVKMLPQKHEGEKGFMLHDAIPISYEYANKLRDNFSNEDSESDDNIRFSVAPKPKTQQWLSWFRQSKMKRGGAPIRFYHGSQSEFTVFDKTRLASNTKHTTAGLGHFFTENKDEATGYGGNVHEVYLSIQNPLVTNSDQLATKFDDAEGAARYFEKLKKAGFDGIYIKDAKYAVAFDSNQAKLTSNEAPTASSDIRFSFAGKKSATADTYQLTSAKQRIESGEDAETVRQETGWSIGADGKPRYEISDHDALYLPYSKNSAGKKWIKPLDEVINHPKLFAAYPQLRNLQVESSLEIESGTAQYDPYDNIIILDASMDFNMQMNVLLHEIQHAIQDEEGFASGGYEDNYKGLRGILDNTNPDYDYVLHKFSDARRAVSDYIWDTHKENKYNFNEDELNNYGVPKKLVDRFLSLKKELEATPKTSFEKYKRLAGEVEARNTQFRAKMSEAERKSKSPNITADTKNSDVIIIFNGKKMNSAPPPANVIGIRFSRTAPNSNGPSGPTNDLANTGYRDFLSETNKKKLDTAIYNLQDRFVDLKRKMEKVVKNGGNIQELEDPRLGEELYHQRTSHRIKSFYADEFTPILQTLHKQGISLDQFQKFLHARHAPSRNAVMAERNPNQAIIDKNWLEAKAELDRTLSGTTDQRMIDKARAELSKWERAKAFRGTEAERLSLSGMSDKDAKDFMNGLTLTERAKLDSLGEKIDKINNETLDLMVSYGMETPQSIKALKDQWDFYVPLHRDEAHPDDNNFGHPIGRGFSVRGSGLKTATGSNAEVTNIMAHIAAAREQMLKRGEKNLVQMRLANFIKNHPDADFAEVGKVPTIDRLVNGLVETLPDPRFKDLDNVVMMRVRGKDVAIVFNDNNPENVRLALSLKNMDGINLNQVESIIAKGTRWLASVNTQYNVVFGVMNLLRDTQGMLLNLTSTPLHGKQGKVFSHMGQALKIISQVERGWSVADPALKEMYERFNKAGGTTGYSQMFEGVKDRNQSIQKELDLLSAGKPRQSWQWIKKSLSDFNTIMENSTRLATFMAGVDAGLSDDQAASIAKNITVNFNRKGAYTTKIGAFYAFFNASMQGTARLAETMAGPKGKQILVGGVALGAMTALLGMASLGDDEWEKIPEFVRERSLILPAPWNDSGYIAIPMPLGFHILPNIGRKFVESAFGSKRVSPQQRLLQLAGSTVGAFNPLGGSDISGMVMPTVLDPALALWRNKDWTGHTIYQADFNSLQPTPGFTRAKNTSTWLAKQAAEAANKLTGGTDAKQGLWSPTPDQLDYVFGQLAGGTGREMMKAEQAAASLVTGDELPMHKIPLLGRVYGETKGAASESQAYYDNLIRLNEHQAEVKWMREHGKGSEVQTYFADNPEARLSVLADGIERNVKKLRHRRDLMKDRGAAQQSIKLVNDKITEQMTRLNDRVLKVMK